MKLSFSLDQTKVTKKLNKALNGIKDLKKPFDAVGDDLLSFFGTTVFEEQGTPIGESWRVLAESTLKARSKRTGYYRQSPVQAGKSLVWTGRLKSGFKKETSKKHLRIYNMVEYYKYHQKRGGRPPQRKMLALTSKVIIRVVEKLNEHLKEQMEK